MKILGVDPSLRNTGLALIETDPIVTPYYLRTISWDRSPKNEEDELKRLRHHRKEFMQFLIAWRPDVVYIEELAFSRPGRQTKLGELMGIFRLTCAELGIKCKLIAATRARKIALEKGNLEKKEIAERLKEKWRMYANNEHLRDALVIALAAYLSESK